MNGKERAQTQIIIPKPMHLITGIYCHFILVTYISAVGHRMLTSSLKQKNNGINCIGKLTQSLRGTELSLEATHQESTNQMVEELSEDSP